MTDTQGTEPIYQQIKTYLRDEITLGNLKEGDRIPSENLLAKEFGVVRMTANRAIIDLVHEGVLHRVKGSGTFVSPARYDSAIVEIRSIADEIASRGHSHSARVLFHSLVSASEAIASELCLGTNISAYHTQLLHYENDRAIQLEDRWVNPKAAPNYLEQDFTKITPTEYLLGAVPLQRAEFRIRAEIPSDSSSRALALGANEPVLVLRRRTFTGETPVTIAELYHPASRFELSGSSAYLERDHRKSLCDLSRSRP